MTLTKPQLIGVVILAAVVLIGVGVLTVMEFGGSKPTAAPAQAASTSPAAQADAPSAGAASASGNTGANGDATTSPLLPDLAADIRKDYQKKQSGNGGVGESGVDASSKDVASSPSTASPAPANGSAGGPPLPAGSVFSEGPPKEAEATAPIGQLESTPERVVVTDSGAPSAGAVPDIPPDIVDQARPESDIQSGAGVVVPTQVKTASKRYLFNNQTAAALGAGVIIPGQSQGKTSYNPDTFSPMGEDISIAFMQNVAGNSFEVPVVVGVWYPFYFQGHKLMETGDKILGRAAPGKNRDRLLITLSTIIFKSGKSMPINALCLDLDGTVGVKGYVVGDRILQILAPVLIEAASTFSQTFQDRTTEVIENDTQGTLGGVIPRVQTVTRLGTDAQTQGIEAARKVGDRIKEIMLEDIEENKPYVLVPAGTIAKARLMAPLDVSQAEYGK